MAQILLKNDPTPGKIPTHLAQGEIAINTSDGTIFYSDGAANNIKQFGISSSYASNSATSSYSLTASYAIGGTDVFPYTGSALITGSLGLTGSLGVIGVLTQGTAHPAVGSYSHAEGNLTLASGSYSHAEGLGTIASGYASHAEGFEGKAQGAFSHAEGGTTTAQGAFSHAEGLYTTATGQYSHAEGSSTITFGYHSHAEGSASYTSAQASHAEGINTVAGYRTALIDDNTDAGGNIIVAGDHTLYYTTATNVVVLDGSGAFIGIYDLDTITFGGTNTTFGIPEYPSQYVGYIVSTTYGQYSHAEGDTTVATGYASHAEGGSTSTTGYASHAEGYNTKTIGDYSHAAGNYTIASGSYQSVIGQYNISSSAQSAFIVGNGTADSARSNLIFASGSQVQITGSVIATQGFTGSLFGTASWALNAATSSYSINPIISGSISNVDYIDFNTGSATPAYKSGRIFWDNTDGALSVYNAEADITLQVGQESWVRVFNEGTTITNGTAVRLIGSHGDVPLIVRAQSQQVSGSALGDNQIIGLATHTIETNSIGYVTTQGLVRGLNTNAFADGDLLFASSSAGLLTNVIPQSPYEVIQVGVCVKAGPGGSGIVFVFPTQPMDFGDLASAERGVYQYGDVWSYQQSGSVGVWKHGRSLSGSYTITGSLNITQGITGSLFGTSSWAVSSSRAVSSSNALTASYVNVSTLGGFVQGGNSFGVTATLGTNDNNSLIFETNNVPRLGISNTGKITSATYNSANSSTRPPIENTFIDLHPESSAFNILPFYANDIAYNTLRGGTFTGTPGPGSTYVTSTSQIEAMFDGAPSYAVLNATQLSGSYTASIVFPQSYQYGNTIGFSFGNTSWRARDFQVEILVTGSYVLLDTVTNYADANYNKSFNYGGQNVQGARISFSNFASPTSTSGFRIADIYLLNYNGQGGKSIFLGRDGGSIYKSVNITGSLDISGSARITNGLTVTGSLIAPIITGSLFGTSSWAVSSSRAVSSSYALTASYALNGGGGGGVTGGATNYIALFSSPTSVTSSILYQTSSNVGIGTTTPQSKLDVNGDALINGLTIGRGGGNTSTNTALGYQALSSSAGGINNIAIGYQVGKNHTGDSSTLIGSNVTPDLANFNIGHALNIGKEGSPHFWAPPVLRVDPASSEKVLEIDSTTYSAAFIDYNLEDGVGAMRAGTLKVIWKIDGTYKLTEEATDSIGDTIKYYFTTSISGGIFNIVLFNDDASTLVRINCTCRLLIRPV